MQYTHINDEVKLSLIVLGCMRHPNLGPTAVRDLIETALDAGINFFDHADIYAVVEDVQKRFLPKHWAQEKGIAGKAIHTDQVWDSPWVL